MAPHFVDGSAPVHVGPTVNSDAIDLEVSISKYLTSDRLGESGGHDVWVSTRNKLKGPE
ncbi:MAG: hypothetical protein ACREJ4_08070 [Candidatus Methylomirabilaceae bacterium]